MPSSCNFSLTKRAVVTSWKPASGWARMVLATSMSQALRASMMACVFAFSSSMVAMVSLRVRGFLKHTAHQRQVLGFGEWCLVICLDRLGMVRPIGEQIDDRHGHGF